MYNAPVVFEFFNSIADNVDYYVFTWNTPDFKHWSLTDSFQNAGITPKVCKVVDIPIESYTSWSGPAYLATLAAPFIRIEHKINPYDAVFETRPDVLSFLTGKTITPIAPNAWYTTQFTNLVDQYNNRNVGMTDHFLAGTVEVYSAMADRTVVHASSIRECHVDMLEFAKRQAISVSNSISWVSAQMTRPADQYRVPDAFAWKMPYNIEVNHEIPVWQNCTIEQRVDMLDKLGIAHYDYITPNNNISISAPGAALYKDIQTHMERVRLGQPVSRLSDLNLD